MAARHRERICEGNGLWRQTWMAGAERGHSFAASGRDDRRLHSSAAGGLIIGAILIFFPQVMGVGYEFVNQALNGGLLLKTMLVLCVVKLVATIVSYSSGNAGGIFSPTL